MWGDSMHNPGAHQFIVATEVIISTPFLFVKVSMRSIVIGNEDVGDWRKPKDTNLGGLAEDLLKNPS